MRCLKPVGRCEVPRVRKKEAPSPELPVRDPNSKNPRLQLTPLLPYLLQSDFRPQVFLPDFFGLTSDLFLTASLRVLPPAFGFNKKFTAGFQGSLGSKERVLGRSFNTYVRKPLHKDLCRVMQGRPLEVLPPFRVGV